MTSPDASDRRQHAPSTERNRDPILAVLRRVLPAQGVVLEVASGTGQHAVAFAEALPGVTWQPSDGDAAALDSIAAWAERAGVPNLAPAVHLDATAPEGWPVARADAMVCINMIHIAPWQACEGLMRGAGRVLAAAGVLALYGPYRRDGVHTAPSNVEFEAWLKARDARYGVRDLEAVADEAARNGLVLEEVVDMPANNFMVIFRRS